MTLKYLQDVLRKRAPRSLKTACLLSKPSRRKVEVPVEYIGFTIEDRFVVGYGLDYDEKYRNLPYIAVLDGGVGELGTRGSAFARSATADKRGSGNGETE